MLLRNATDNDFQLLVDMFLEDIAPLKEEAIQFANDLLNRMRTILVFSDKQLAGSFSWEVRGGLEDGVVEIVGLGIRPRFRRKGLGKRMIEKAIDEIDSFFDSTNHQLRILYLFMESDNDPAKNLYLSLGFKEVVEISRFYPEHNASIWIKRIH